MEKKWMVVVGAVFFFTMSFACAEPESPKPLKKKQRAALSSPDGKAIVSGASEMSKRLQKAESKQDSKPLIEYGGNQHCLNCRRSSVDNGSFYGSFYNIDSSQDIPPKAKS